MILNQACVLVPQLNSMVGKPRYARMAARGIKFSKSWKIWTSSSQISYARSGGVWANLLHDRHMGNFSLMFCWSLEERGLDIKTEYWADIVYKILSAIIFVNFSEYYSEQLNSGHGFDTQHGPTSDYIISKLAQICRLGSVGITKEVSVPL